MNEMIDRMTGDAMLARRLEAYAEARLSPDLTTSSRLRARVLAVAHRHADVARADAGLVVLPRPEGAWVARSLPVVRRGARPGSGTPGRVRWQRATGALLAASLGIGLAAGGAFAARPSGPLYDARLWVETLTLPADPSARAVAQLDRLEQRLAEVDRAGRSGDLAGVAAAVAAYEAILDEASASAILTGDDVAAVILEIGVAHNLDVLRALVGRVPATAGAAITAALDRAIERSAAAVDRFGASHPGHDDGHGAGTGQPTTDPTPRPTKAATPDPTAVPADAATAKPKPTRDVTPEPSPKAPPEPTRPPDTTQPPKDDRDRPVPPAPPESPRATHAPGPGANAD